MTAGRFLKVLCVAAFLSWELSYSQEEQPKAKISPLPTPNDAVLLALLDIKSRPEADRPFIRYLWIPDGSIDAIRAASFSINTISRSGVINRPVPVVLSKILNPKAMQRGKVVLLRLDLRHYAPGVGNLKEYLTLWEDLQFDPRFNLLITKGALKLISLKLPHWQGKGWVCSWRKEKCPDYVFRGKTYSAKWARFVELRDFRIGQLDLKNVEVVRFSLPTIDPRARASLELETNSQAPIITDAYFNYRVLSAIQDKGLYSVIYGGRYYDFAGIRKSAKKGKTDEDQLLEDLGLQENARALFAKLNSDRRAGIFRSLVTGKPRQMEFFRIPASGFDVSTGLISITHDLKDQDIDVDTHPIFNLLNFKDQAREVIWERANGLHGYALFNGDGARQDEAPPDVVKDHTIPAPHSGRLQPAISCISCHQTEGSDGWKKVVNDVKVFVNSRQKLDIFGDVGQRNQAISETVDRVAALYKGEPENAFIKGRDDYARNVLYSTGPWPELKAQVQIVKAASTAVVKRWRDYWYDTVTPQQALRELGLEVGPKDAKNVFNALMKPDVRAAVPVPEIGDVIIPEDPRIGALKAGLSIPRSDWDLVYAFAAERALHNLSQQKGSK